MRWLNRLVTKHLRHPRGFFGRRVARRMNAVNLEIYELALANLDIGADEHLLDIGFGGGPAFRQLCDLVPEGGVAGVDSSKTMLALAEKSFHDLVAAKRLSLHPGTFQRLPFQTNRFDKIFTVNTIYFWDDPDAVLSEIVRILKPEGRVAIGFREPDDTQRAGFEENGFVFRSRENIHALCAAAGLADIRFVEQSKATIRFACALARKPDHAATSMQ